jgi:hypothetical protein
MTSGLTLGKPPEQDLLDHETGLGDAFYATLAYLRTTTS